MKDDSRDALLCITWIAALVFVGALLLYALCHRCPVTTCQNPACCKAVAEAPQK